MHYCLPTSILSSVQNGAFSYTSRAFLHVYRRRRAAMIECLSCLIFKTEIVDAAVRTIRGHNNDSSYDTSIGW